MWAHARARNALRRRRIITGVGLVAFGSTLAALILVPREAIREARNAAPLPGEKVDSIPLVAALAAVQEEYRTANGAVAAKRAAAARATAALVAARQRALAAALAAARPVGNRDSLRAASAELGRLIDRARTSPLPSSYRALAEAPGVRGDPRVRALVDSLDDVERERESYGVGGVDPVYVSLTNRATQLGRAVEAIAERRRAALEDQLNAPDVPPPVAPAPPVPAPVAAAPAATASGTTASGTTAPAVRDSTGEPVRAAVRVAPRAVVADTAVEAGQRAVVATRLAQAQRALAAARIRDVAADRRVEAARARAGFDTPPLAIAAAALILGAALGFGVAFLTEVRRPRVADAEEAERVTRSRVLAVVRPSAGVTPERGRRLVDERLDGAGAGVRIPALVDPAVEGYRLLYLGLAPIGAAVPRMAITAAEPAVAAAVALNLAAAAAEDGRSTLIVDADPRSAVLSAALGVRDRIGLVDLARAGFAPREAVVPVAVGRDVSVDVLPAGLTAIASGGRPPAPAAVPEEDDPRAVLARLARAYDVTVTSIPPAPAPGGQSAAAVATPQAAAESLAREVLAREVIVCARAGHTPLASLTREIARLNAAGARVRGLVVWDDALPAVRG